MNQKAIQIAQKIKGANGQKYKNSIDYLFIATDLSVTAKYIIEGNTKWRYLPSLGFNVGFHKAAGYEITSSISGLTPGLSSTDEQSFIAATIQIGFGVKPPFTILKFPFELNCNLIYNPKRFLKNAINVPPVVIQGKYHSLSIGMNFYLRRLKSNF